MTRPPARLSLVAFAAFGLGALLPSCELRNPDHCFNRASDTNAWCAQADPQRPYCSPCAAEFSGCVSDEPTPESCPEYSAAAGTGTSTGTGTGTSTGTGTGTGG